MREPGIPALALAAGFSLAYVVLAVAEGLTLPARRPQGPIHLFLLATSAASLIYCWIRVLRMKRESRRDVLISWGAVLLILLLSILLATAATLRLSLS